MSYRVLLGNRIKEVEVECIVHGRDEQCIQNFRMKIEERDHMRNLGMV
jgi:hypothetical protein